MLLFNIKLISAFTKPLNIYSTINMSSKVKGYYVGKLENRILVYLNDELSLWLDVKASQGYKKATLIRKVLDDYRKAEVVHDGGTN